MVGVAFSVGSVMVLGEGTSRRSLVLAGLLAAAGMLTKQSLFAAPAAGVLWLLGVNREKAVVFAASTLVPVAVCALFAELMTGSFLANTMLANANPFSMDSVHWLGLLFFLLQAPALVLAGLYLVSARPWQSTGTPRLLVLYWLFTLVSVAGIIKFGADVNYWIEFAAVNAILASLGVQVMLKVTASRRQAIASNLCVTLCLVYVGVMAIGSVGDSLNSGLHVGLQPDPGFDALVDRVRAEPRQVLASPSDVVVLAGRPLLLEPLIYSLFFETNGWDAEPIVQRICDGEVGLVILSKPLDEPDPRLLGFALWPAPVWTAMQRAMALERQTADRYVYVPRQTNAASLCA
jgi:hypothetical protein